MTHFLNLPRIHSFHYKIDSLVIVKVVGPVCLLTRHYLTTAHALPTAPCTAGAAYAGHLLSGEKDGSGRPLVQVVLEDESGVFDGNYSSAGRNADGHHRLYFFDLTLFISDSLIFMV